MSIPSKKRAIVFVPAGGEARQRQRACAEYCDRRGYALRYVTGSVKTVWSMLHRGLVDVVVVAREVDRERLQPVEIVQ